MLQGNINKTSASPTPAGDVAQALDALQRTVVAVQEEAGRLSDGLQAVMRAAHPEEEAKAGAALGYSTPLAATLQSLNDQLEKALKLLNSLNARLSI